VFLSLPGLHDSHCHSINDVLALIVNIGVYIVVLLLCSLRVLMGLSWNKVNLEVLVLELSKDCNGLFRSKLSILLVLFLKSLLLWIAEIQYSTVELLLILNAC
jgi:hypothetical protein